MKKCMLLTALVVLVLGSRGQRQYASHSVLATGSWVKISTTGQGVFKVSAADLRSAGVGTVASAQLALFGSGGAVLPESNALESIDDLPELAIWMEDGGDGEFSGNDYFLFYAPGLNRWQYDSLAAQFRFFKNPYADKAFFFIKTSGTGGKRIQQDRQQLQPNKTVTQYDGLFRYELDSINFLRSGKEWYGEDFGNQQGRLSVRTFPVIQQGVAPGSSFSLTSEIVGRSAGQPNRMVVAVNGNKVVEHTTAPLIGTLLEPAGNTSRVSASGRSDAPGLSVSYTFSGSSVNAQAWLNWFELHYRRVLDMAGINQFVFRDRESVAPGLIAQFTISNPATDARAWDITDFGQPVGLSVTAQSGQLQFTRSVASLREYTVFNPALADKVVVEGAIQNQDLHGLVAPDMLIVADKDVFLAAERLAAFHRQRGLKVLVEDPRRIFNEFSSGIPDPTAIRNFIRMFHERAMPTGKPPLQYLLLFGGASYHFKGKLAAQWNKVPAYQSDASLDPLTSYVTDDYYGYLERHEDIRVSQPAPTLDLAIGRIPARNLQQANQAVDKIIRYHQPAGLGAWRTGITLVADDEDFNLHLNDAEFHAGMINREYPEWQLNKIYLDAYSQQSNAGGSRYPEANKAIVEGVNSGTLIWNYSGHGGSARLAQEAILEADGLAAWENTTRLPLLITATCDFAPFDDPEQFSLGEDLLVGRNNGSIGLMTTTRLVFASSNRVINHNFLRFILKKNATGRYPTLGEALRDSKNFTVASSGEDINTRKFIMLGDPAMKLAMPEWNVKTTTVNGKSVSPTGDTLKALGNYTIEGVVLDEMGQEKGDFNGYVYPRLYDKPEAIKTLANDPQSFAVDFQKDNRLLFTGKIPVKSGKFSFTLTVPADADIRFGQARLAYYAENGTGDAMGLDNHFIVGGRNSVPAKDTSGPVIKALLNTEQFRDGDKVNQTPLLIIKLADESGINVSGNGIGHDIVAILDNDARTAMVLNDYYVPETAASGYAGSIRIRLPELTAGKHTLFVRAWDVLNQSAQTTINFEVVPLKEIPITTLKAFPNPLSSQTVFSIGLDGDTRGAMVSVVVFAMDGRRLWQHEKAINEAALRSLEIPWNAVGRPAGSMPPGVYFCRVIVKSREGVNTTKTVKLVVL
ncbi:MAG: type secretion system sortase PorU [Bacteroidota bacterium]